MTVFWSLVSRNGRTLRARRADLVGDLHRTRLQIGFRAPLAQDQAELEEEELLEDHPPLRGRPERVQLFDRRALGGKVHVVQRRAAVHELQFRAHARGERIGDGAGQLLERVMHECALHLGGEVAGLLVHRDDAAGVERVFGGGRTKVACATGSSGVSLSACRISYCGFCICNPCEVSSSLPKRITRWCGWKTSFRNGWLNQIARNEPVGSRRSNSKILKRGRRVGRMPEPMTSPPPMRKFPVGGRSMVRKDPRSS